MDSIITLQTVQGVINKITFIYIYQTIKEGGRGDQAFTFNFRSASGKGMSRVRNGEREKIESER